MAKLRAPTKWKFPHFRGVLWNGIKAWVPSLWEGFSALLEGLLRSHRVS
jgi:hypothetical protein